LLYGAWVFLLLGRYWGGAEFVKGVNEVAAGSIGAISIAVVGSAALRLVLGMPVDAADFVGAVRKLTLFAIAACAVLLVGSAHFRLIARAGLLLLGGRRGLAVGGGGRGGTGGN
jgi:malonyl CoA-acyl carrier protein transacylase